MGTKDYFSAIWHSVGGKWLFIPGAVSGLIGIYGFLQHQLAWLPAMSWWIVFPLAFAPVFIWVVVGLTVRVVALERKLNPGISVFIDSDTAGVSTYPTNNNRISKWAQIGVSSSTDMPLVDCEVRLTSLARIHEDGSSEIIEREPIFCIWSNLGVTRTGWHLACYGSCNPRVLETIRDIGATKCING
jgi:hypothetical protein